MISYIILLSLITLIYFYNKNLKENYLNYKAVVITPNKNVYIKPKIFFKKGVLISQHISNVLGNNLPIKKTGKKYTHYFLLNDVKINNIVVSTLYDYLKYISVNQNNNIRFISKLFKQSLTIVTNSKIIRLSDYNGQTIYVNSKNSSEFYILQLLKPYYKFKINFLEQLGKDDTKKYNISGKYFNKYKNISICYFTNHPNIELIKLIKDNPKINIVSIDKYERKIMKNLIEDFEEDKIDSNFYYKYRTDMIPTFSNPMVLVTHKNTNDNIVYKINQFIYNNFSMFKITKNDDLKNSVKYYSLNDTYFSSNDFYEIHSGTHKFYIDHGFISNIDRNICRKYVSIKYCDLSDGVRLNPYRLL